MGLYGTACSRRVHLMLRSLGSTTFHDKIKQIAPIRASHTSDSSKQFHYSNLNVSHMEFKVYHEGYCICMRQLHTVMRQLQPLMRWP